MGKLYESALKIWRDAWPERKGELKAGALVFRSERPLVYPVAQEWQTRGGYRNNITPEIIAREGAKLNAIVFACLTSYAFAFPEASLECRTDKDGREAPAHDSALQAILDNPNDDHSQSDLMRVSIWYAALGGRVYLYKLRSTDGRMVGLFPYSAAHIVTVPGQYSTVDHYEYVKEFRPGAAQIPRNDIIAFDWPSVNTRNVWEPCPPLLAVVGEIGTDNELRRYVNTVLANDAVVKGVITDKSGYTSASQAESLSAQWNQNHGGDQRGGTAVLIGGLTYQRVALGLNELAFDALHGVSEDRIAAALNIPPVVAGLTSGDRNSTYNNVEQADERFTYRSLVPLWKQFADKISTGCANEFASDSRRIWVVPNTAKVRAMGDDEDAMHIRARTDYIQDLVTLNEAREMLGLASVDGGDRFYTATKLALSADATPAQALEITGEAAPAKSRERKAIATAGINKLHGASEEYLKSYFKGYDAPAAKAAAKLKEALQKPLKSIRSQALRSIGKKNLKEGGGVFDDEAAREGFIAATSEILSDLIGEQMDQAVTEVGENWSAIKTDFDTAIDRALNGSLDKVTTSIGTIKEELTALVKANRTLPVDELRDLITEKFDFYTSAGAARIARTSSTFATGASQKEAWEGLKITYVWLTQRDGDVRDEHEEADGQKPIGGLFNVGGDSMAHPCGGSDPAMNVNCRCVLRARPTEKIE